MKTSEVAPNVYVTESIALDFLSDPTKWLERYKDFPRKFVGGIHNLSQHDKKAWADRESQPLRVIEVGTGREEVWFPIECKGPEYISLDADGRLTSHLKVSRFQPTLKQESHRSYIPGSEHSSGSAELLVWYHNDNIHRNPDRCEGPDHAPAVLSTKMTVPIADADAEYIHSVYFTLFQEFWANGKWKKTTAGSMTIIFTNSQLNTPAIQTKTSEWLAKHCQGGFFPFSETLFGDEEEEFLFVADICARA